MGPGGGNGGASDRGITTPIDGEGAAEPTPTITFPEDSDVADAEQRLAMPIRGFVPLPTILSESEDESSSLSSRYNSDSDDEDFFSSRSTLTSPSPSLEDISVLAMEAQNLRDLSSDIAVTLAPTDIAAGDGTGDRGISAPIDGVPAQDGGVESRTTREPAAAPAPTDIAARDGIGDRGIDAPIDGVPGQDSGAEAKTPQEPAAPQLL
ncbi:hypothetical protein O998_03115 [Anaplasma phagocytophilum str. Norway variant1]|uniref:Uncharacterized protein n=1 Tax=Anaplasma phagocytophilum str. Norway variant1 TaxID=1392506 RepID=A0A7H9DZ41_ANAPH|nr:hypothetical protein [Anaplasma phagocytophilum]QLL66780.1 hypothetical protein O998_03115 [Anaplasma phagocytophilum str. Norway variant1]